MVRISIKSLSLNQAYIGRRFATPALKDFKMALSLLLPKQTVPEGKLSVRLAFGVSSAGADLDNQAKTMIDALSENYGFNDNRVYKIEMEKIITKKGAEYIDFELLALQGDY